MTQDIKDWMHYSSAIGMLISCVILSFISFLTLHLVHSTVLMYVSLCIMFAAGVYGVTLYFNNSLGQFGTQMDKNMRTIIQEELSRHRQESHPEDPPD